MSVKGLRERLRDGENIVCAEGYMWELERRGFVCSGDFTPEVVIDYPERVQALSEEFALAGSDVIEAFTYYAHREKLKSIGRETDLKDLNLQALGIAREVADARGCLMAGNICNTTCYNPADPDCVAKSEAIFKEQMEWIVEAKADFVIAETFVEFSEAKLALECIQKYGQGLPSVVTLSAHCNDVTLDGLSYPEALRELEKLGADVVGLNCGRGPETMMPLLRDARAVCKGPLAALPVPFRTTPEQNNFNILRDPRTGERLFPANLACCQSSREDVRRFAEDALALGIQYVGLCCGSSPSLIREMAQVYGRKTELDKYTPSTARNFYFQDNPRSKVIREFLFGKDTVEDSVPSNRL